MSVLSRDGKGEVQAYVGGTGAVHALEVLHNFGSHHEEMVILSRSYRQRDMMVRVGCRCCCPGDLLVGFWYDTSIRFMDEVDASLLAHQQAGATATI